MPIWEIQWMIFYELNDFGISDNYQHQNKKHV